jgi:putative flavoprotein involved in K+ transport
LILEKGAGPGESWRRMPANLKLVSPWKSNRLPGTPLNYLPANGEISRSTFFQYLQSYSQWHRLPLATGVAVFGVERLPENSFRVRTSQGDYTSRFVVNATGCFSHPFVPVIPGAGASGIPQRHVADYHDSQQVRALLGHPAGRVLIVGKRLSAGQTMVELAGAGFEVELSCRFPIQFGAGPLTWWFLFRIFPWLEWLRLKTRGESAPGNDVKMQGGRARELIARGTVKTHPPIQSFESDGVVFQDGTRAQFDLVIYATGFRPALEHLTPLAITLDQTSGLPQLRDLESISTTGLFFLGLDGARNFQSRFLRGIRNDARFLAGRIFQRLNTVSSADSAQGSTVAATILQSRIETMNCGRTSSTSPHLLSHLSTTLSVGPRGTRPSESSGSWSGL